jgi:hypothetical protein
MKAITPRERVLTTIAHREPDRVPYNLRLISDLIRVAQAQIGTSDYAEYYGHDVRYVIAAFHAAVRQFGAYPAPGRR